MNQKITQNAATFRSCSFVDARSAYSGFQTVRLQRPSIFFKKGADMFKKLSIVIFFAFLAAVAILGSGVSAVSSQDTLADFKGNNCVTCHARLSNPYRLTSRYAE
ncbi:MAG TPA: hypothetical protein PKC13_27545, partial [Blastocatellia bacterium]|nr:hypothetical protein [Blastocatellia bacterium]